MNEVYENQKFYIRTGGEVKFHQKTGTAFVFYDENRQSPPLTFYVDERLDCAEKDKWFITEESTGVCCGACSTLAQCRKKINDEMLRNIVRERLKIPQFQELQREMSEFKARR